MESKPYNELTDSELLALCCFREARNQSLEAKIACRGPLSPTGHNVDRVDNRKGYEWSNVVPCCGPCNTRKGYLEGAGFTYPRNVELLRELLKQGDSA